MIREVRNTDFEGLMELYMQLHDNPMPEKSPELMDLWKRILEDENHHIIVAEAGGEDCILLRLRDHSESDTSPTALCFC